MSARDAVLTELEPEARVILLEEIRIGYPPRL